MSRLSYHITEWVPVPPELLFAVLWDVPGWARWAPLVGRSSWQDDDASGVGSVRLLGGGAILAREQVTVHEPPLRHGYTILADRPARDYQALVELEPEDHGTRLTWSGSFEPNPPGLGHAYAWFVRRYIARLAAAACGEALRRSTSDSEVPPTGRGA